MNRYTISLACTIFLLISACENQYWEDLGDNQSENVVSANERVETNSTEEVIERSSSTIADAEKIDQRESTKAGTCAFDLGVDCSQNAEGIYSVSLGRQTYASGYGATALGRGTIAGPGTYATALVAYTEDSGNAATTMGWNTKATGEYSLAKGRQIQATGRYAVAVGLGQVDQQCNQANSMCIMGGNVGIGTTSPDHKLDVDGTIAAEEIIVQAVQADYVFGNNYDLMSLDEVEEFISQNNHLPGVPSSDDIAVHGGVSLGDSHTLLLQKIEEMTLHLIEQNKQLEAQQKELSLLKQKVN